MKLETLAEIAGRSPTDKTAGPNMKAFLLGMDLGGNRIQWHKRVVQAQVLGQVCHEGGGFLYDREIWGPNAVQQRYEDRTDLGHSPAVPGEAFAFRGKGPLQVTGRFNHREFTEWARKIDPAAPDFEKDPEKLLTDPWEGLSVVWYWEWKKLTPYCLEGKIGSITYRVNGGYNGFADRMRYYARASLVLLGREPTQVARYQMDRGLTADGIPGENTCAALHKDLLALPDDIPVDHPEPVSAAQMKLDAIAPLVAQIQTIMEK